MNNPLVSIAIHIGKQDYYPLLENLLKSFLVCNRYPNIELILIESGGNQQLRDWLSKINFEQYFVNYDGASTTIQKKANVNITKKLLFLDYPDDIPWFMCYSDAIRKSIEYSTGAYFTLLAEDNQFIIEGDIIKEYIDTLQHVGEDTHMLYFASMQLYKYFKPNNAFDKMQDYNGIKYFPIKNVKWCSSQFCNKKVLEKIGPLALSDEEDPHRMINYSLSRVTKLKFKRCYKAIPAAVWFHNSYRDEFIDLILKNTRKNPDYILLSTTTLSEINNFFDKNIGNSDLRPLSTEDWYNRVNVEN